MTSTQHRDPWRGKAPAEDSQAAPAATAGVIQSRQAARGGIAAIVALAIGVSIAAGAGGTGGPAGASPSGAAPGGSFNADATVSATEATRLAQAAPAEPGTEGEPRAGIDLDPAQVTADSLISRHQAEPRDPNKGPVTNLPLPRYVSLKGGEGNARRGPSLSHRIDWVFRHPGMPLRVVAEFGHWRRVEDQDGAGGWVHYSLLSGVRTAIVTTDMAELRGRGDTNGTVIARAEAGAIVRLHECTRDWCRVSGEGAKGWVPKTSLWGVDADETRD